MSTFTQRLGNIIAWATFAVLIASVSLVVPLAVEVVDYQQHLKQIDWERNVQEQPSPLIESLACHLPRAAEAEVAQGTTEDREALDELYASGFKQSKCVSEASQYSWQGETYWLYHSGVRSIPFLQEEFVRTEFGELNVGYKHTSQRRFEDEWLVSVVFSAALWGCLLVAQYLFYGLVRVLPWKHK